MNARFKKQTLVFKTPSGTSRGILKTKDSWILGISNAEFEGIGECSIIEGLSFDDTSLIEKKLNLFCENPTKHIEGLEQEFQSFPAIRMAIETAILDINSGGNRELFDTEFTKANKGILINGLIWMAEKAKMYEQIKEKISQGFQCIKLKIGAIDFKDEIELLRYIRSQFSADDLELRVDANGAFSSDNALEKLKKLSEINIHSIEQPIAVNKHQEMAELCEKSPIPIALDEELIGVHESVAKQELLNSIKPQFIILKPSLVGGFKSAQEWIDIAQSLDIAWWVTSALESNIGLNAIAQWTSSLHTTMPQGLGTGKLFNNNIKSPLNIIGQHLHYDINAAWAKIF